MVGEVATGRCTIGKLCRYLWRTHFYWIVDCKAVEAIIDYHGDNRLLSCWLQELLGYAFTLVHRPAAMMVDVDGVCHFEGIHPLVARYEKIAATYMARHCKAKPRAYKPASVDDINKSGLLGPGRKQKRRNPKPNQREAPKSCGLCVYRSTAPVCFVLPPSADALPANDALHLLSPWWLSADGPMNAMEDALHLLHSRAEVVFVVQEEVGRAAVSSQCAQSDVYACVADFIAANSTATVTMRPLLGADLHCMSRDCRGQLEWSREMSQVVGDLQRQFDLPYFVLSLRGGCGVTPGDVLGCVAELGNSG